VGYEPDNAQLTTTAWGTMHEFYERHQQRGGKAVATPAYAIVRGRYVGASATDTNYSYYKVNESDFCERITRQFKGLNTPLNIVVINFIDMLSHSRTDSKMMRELANDEAAYRSLTLSWFKHSATAEMFKRIAALGYKVILTTDHGTTRVSNPVQIVGDKNTNTNLRYKVGKSLNCSGKNCMEITRPKQVGLPTPNVSSSYVFCSNDDFFAYPNNFNYYAQFYRNTFQHGGISLEEMLIPLITLDPK
jgi:hypothetical protein